MKRSLALKREHLADLTPNDLSSVAGGTTTLFTGYYPSLNAPCPTLDGCIDVAPILSVHRPCPTLDGCFTGTTLYTVAC